MSGYGTCKTLFFSWNQAQLNRHYEFSLYECKSRQATDSAYAYTKPVSFNSQKGQTHCKSPYI